jgi:hypothetical protein
MNDLTIKTAQPPDTRFAPVDAGVECNGFFFKAQYPVKQHGVFVQHWESEECSVTVFRLANGWFIGGEQQKGRRIFETQDAALRAAVADHMTALRKAFGLIKSYATKQEIQAWLGGRLK